MADRPSFQALLVLHVLMGLMSAGAHHVRMVVDVLT